MIGRKIGRPAPALRHRNREQLRQLDDIRTPARAPHFRSEKQDRIVRFNQHPRGVFDHPRIRNEIHRNRNALFRKNLALDVLLIKNVSRHAQKSRASRWRRRNFECVREPLRNAVAFLRDPSPLRVLLESLQPVVDILGTIATVGACVGVIGHHNQRRAVLHRVEHVGARERSANAAEAGERRLSGCFCISIGDRNSLMF